MKGGDGSVQVSLMPTRGVGIEMGVDSSPSCGGNKKRGYVYNTKKVERIHTYARLGLEGRGDRDVILFEGFDLLVLDK